jgi:putative lipoic acid-binding regulatory protein
MVNMKSLIEKAEALDWKVTDSRECGFTVEKGVTELEFSKYSPAGEDFSFSVSGRTQKELKDEIKNYVNDFDVDEHIELWIEARKNGVGGVPNIRELVKDADDIYDMLEELAIEVSK